MMNVLIVDDEAINILLLESLLMDKYHTQTAKNGEIAYNMIKDQKPDVVLLDVLMPVMDGFTTLKKIRDNKQLDDIIVIMVTAKIDKSYVTKALLAGADDYIKKPIDATDLYTKLDIHLKLRKQTGQISDYQVYANIHESMISAQRIQKSLLPDKKSFKNVFPNSFALYKPRDMVGGDLYFVSQHTNKKFISIVDNTGHGVPAAMLSMLTYMSLNYIVNWFNITNPAEVATQVSTELSNIMSGSSDTFAPFFNLDACFCRIDSQSNILTYSNVRRPIVIVRKKASYIVVNNEEVPPVISNDNYHLFYIRGDLAILGKLDINKIELINNEIELMPEDMLYMFSDGVTDQFGGPKDKKFSKKRFLQLLLDCQEAPLSAQKLRIYQELEQWSMSCEQTDDIVIIGIKV